MCRCSPALLSAGLASRGRDYNPGPLNRRSFLLGASAATLALVLPAGMKPALASRQTYILWLERMDTGEQIAEPFSLDGTSVYKRGYYDLCATMRDAHVPPWRGDVYISITLIELLWGIQQALMARGVREPIVVHSGYRTPETNANTEGAAWNSLHMYGMAIDFHVPNVSIDDLADFCWSCPGAGGVGSYAGGWVHLDTGPHRFWNG
jgi:uncharacterized protein YcbK (DUF882 family)